MRRLRHVAEQPLAAPEDDREDHEAELVDAARAPRASWTSAALPATSRSPSTRFAEARSARARRRRGPPWCSARSRRRPRSVEETTYLGMRVHPVGEAHRVLHGGPCRGEGLVGHTAEQLASAPSSSSSLNRSPSGPRSNRKVHPACREPLGAARVLHDPVQRDELGYNDPSHLCLLVVDAAGGVATVTSHTNGVAEFDSSGDISPKVPSTWDMRWRAERSTAPTHALSHAPARPGLSAPRITESTSDPRQTRVPLTPYGWE